MKNKARWKIYRDYIIGWTLAFIFLGIVRGVGTVELGSVQFELSTTILVSLVTGPFFGTLSAFGLIFTERRIFRKEPIHKVLLIRVIYSAVFLGVLVLVFYVIIRSLFGIDIGLVEFAFEPGSFAIYFYILMVDFVMSVLRQINLLLGGQNFRKLLMGKFFNPSEEQRIFMFLDLRSSTQIAEKLGHIQYSKLIQDCFNDLGVVNDNEAEIYQYVGDEAILTWKLKDGLKRQNCLKAFFNFKHRLLQNQANYLQKYDVLPTFKAGLNMGEVTVAEVGKYKKEIAFHGDTINTAARIQSKCNEFNQELLVSENIKNHIDPEGFRFTSLGNIPLEGKQHDVSIYAVSIAEILEESSIGGQPSPNFTK